MKKLYYVEVTDSFAGEANYAWLLKFRVSASSFRGAMRKVANRVGGRVRMYYGNNSEQTWVWLNQPIIAFICEFDELDHQPKEIL